jgi:hypothetical protein
MVMSPVGLLTKNHCAGEGQQRFSGQSQLRECLKTPSRAITEYNMVMRPLGLLTKNHCAGEGQ